ncbi:DUF2927 domain-containing protein [Defluviimonas sp. WL0050]|uniref:DUF2927 domain-containing protein n=1 Tax=Albidovulum litorale TaxID=2984134 RepID=A0ABT2ZJK4_9RHOB|nr:DUF2927 domain-containing protein [Defluviimonas sp. WL0050]MCV2871296.1 DUF2927 domain-containing protein [Defluviimonas sp. WL0050]
MRFHVSWSVLYLPILMVGLSACTTTGPGPESVAGGTSGEPRITTPSPQSQVERAYYARVEANYLAQDLLRVDGGAEDAPFGPRELAENFLRIAFFDEFTERGGQLVAEASENRLHRWRQPVRIGVEFGASVPLEQRRADEAVISDYASRLSRLTGLPIRVSTWRPNHVVMIVNAGERAGVVDRIRVFAPEVSDAALDSVAHMRPDTYCTVFSFTPGQSASYSGALTVIRGELPDRLRLSCIHEELAQSLGLVADHPRARPSIFNDNEEFALLTRQDELMLRMLYDRRLSPGMTLAEARPIVEAMAAELLPAGS